MKKKMRMTAAAIAVVAMVEVVGAASNVIYAAEKDTCPTIFLFPLASARENAYVVQSSLWSMNENLYGLQVSPVLGL